MPLTELHKVIEKLDVEAFESLIERITDINAVDDENKTPLHYVLANNHDEYMISSLINRGADINARDNEGKTPLHYAVDDFTTKIN